MSKFIRLKTVSGADLLLRTKWISSICGCPEKSFTRVELYNAIDHDDAYDVTATVDEIQAMIDDKRRHIAGLTIALSDKSISDQLRSLLGQSSLTLSGMAKCTQITRHKLEGFRQRVHELNASNSERLAKALGYRIVLVPEAKETT